MQHATKDTDLASLVRQLDIDKENIDIDNLTDDDIEIISERLFDPKEMYG